MVACQAYRCQRAADFLAVDVDIIGPLDESGKWKVESGK